MKSIKGRLKIRLNDASKLYLRVNLIDILSFANEFKLGDIKDDVVVTYAWFKPGSDWKLIISDIQISEILETLGVSYVSDKSEYESSEQKMSYTEYLKNLLPYRLNSQLLKTLDDTYDAQFELYV